MDGSERIAAGVDEGGVRIHRVTQHTARSGDERDFGGAPCVPESAGERGADDGHRDPRALGRQQFEALGIDLPVGCGRQDVDTEPSRWPQGRRQYRSCVRLQVSGRYGLPTMGLVERSETCVSLPDERLVGLTDYDRGAFTDQWLVLHHGNRCEL
ncbi:hypothetical protein SDC9_49498 [bioreactor metagenome]|uniref:Uncharacterized protein n=1 Tax=bioreactor metagenome TaxID=1076179 RepID=A0A644WLD9_9ZZZZ